jgi:hypothetical protein
MQIYLKSFLVKSQWTRSFDLFLFEQNFQHFFNSFNCKMSEGNKEFSSLFLIFTCFQFFHSIFFPMAKKWKLVFIYLLSNFFKQDLMKLIVQTAKLSWRKSRAVICCWFSLLTLCFLLFRCNFPAFTSNKIKSNEEEK